MGGLARKALLCHTGSREVGTSRGGKKAGMRDGRPESRPSLAADPLCDISERGAVVVAGTVYSQVPREPGSRAFLTSRVLTLTSLKVAQTYLTQAARWPEGPTSEHVQRRQYIRPCGSK